jgi:hypothetical protein
MNDKQLRSFSLKVKEQKLEEFRALVKCILQHKHANLSFRKIAEVWKSKPLPAHTKGPVSIPWALNRR